LQRRESRDVEQRDDEQRSDTHLNRPGSPNEFEKLINEERDDRNVDKIPPAHRRAAQNVAKKVDHAGDSLSDGGPNDGVRSSPGGIGHRGGSDSVRDFDDVNHFGDAVNSHNVCAREHARRDRGSGGPLSLDRDLFADSRRQKRLA